MEPHLLVPSPAQLLLASLLDYCTSLLTLLPLSQLRLSHSSHTPSSTIPFSLLAVILAPSEEPLSMSIVCIVFFSEHTPGAL